MRSSALSGARRDASGCQRVQVHHPASRDRVLVGPEPAQQGGPAAVVAGVDPVADTGIAGATTIVSCPSCRVAVCLLTEIRRRWSSDSIHQLFSWKFQ
ncbi:hypothetical protein [Saccharopolyspora antimicrobica]|uniref:hypothetical protein n=1 Tax=Saccharopolyspora antimicrobica TaxID=455193 RepID=UPI001BAADE0E|nr:hypothetical protein [Saccharopolyspora antimicrobica]